MKMGARNFEDQFMGNDFRRSLTPTGRQVTFIGSRKGKLF
jgi:hypothetical protein